MVITVFTTKERIVPVQQNTGKLSTELKDLAKQLPFLIVPLAAMSAFFYYRNIPTGIFFVVIFAAAIWYIRRTINDSSLSDVTGSKKDMLDLMTNKPWLILLGIGFLTMMFNGIKYGVIAYYFKYFIGEELLAGQYFIALLVVSILGALSTSYLAEKFGRKRLFIIAMAMSSLITCGFYWIPADNVTMVFAIGCGAEYFAAMMPTLFFSMLGDSADYSEWRNGRRATGL
jgi:Na+/melibiose symporter-like transporter